MLLWVVACKEPLAGMLLVPAEGDGGPSVGSPYVGSAMFFSERERVVFALRDVSHGRAFDDV